MYEKQKGETPAGLNFVAFFATITRCVLLYSPFYECQFTSLTPSLTMSNTYGLQLYGNRLRQWAGWTVEPDISVMVSIIRPHLHLDSSISCHVTPLAKGTFNKVYKVEVLGDKYVMRVALPLEVPYRISSEVATTAFICENVSTRHMLSLTLVIDIHPISSCYRVQSFRRQPITISLDLDGIRVWQDVM